MAQLPRIAADQGLPVAGQVQHQTVQTPLAIATAPGEAQARLGETVTNVAEGITQGLIQLRRSTQYNQKSTEAHLTVDAGLRNFEAGNYDFSNPEQHEAYVTAVTAFVDKVNSNTLAKVKDPEVRARLQADLIGQRERAIYRSRDYARTQEIDSGKVQLAQSLDVDIKLAVQAGDRATFSEYMNNVVGRISQAANDKLITRTESYKTINDAVEMAVANRALFEGTTQPLDTANAVILGEDIFGVLDQSKRMTIAGSIVTRYNQQIAAEDRLIKQKQETNYSASIARMAQGSDEKQYLIASGPSGTNEISGEDQIAGIKLNATARTALAEPSNPAIYRRIGLAVNEIPPTTTAREIDKLTGNGLTIDDGIAFKATLISNQERHASRVKADDKFSTRYTQGEQLLMQSLTTKSPFEKLDPQEEAIKSLALGEWTRRVLDGGEDPLVVQRELAPFYQSMQIERIRLSAGALRAGILPVYKNKPLVTQDDVAVLRVQLEQDKSRMAAGTYEAQKSILNELSNRLNDATILERRRTEQRNQGGGLPQY